VFMNSRSKTNNFVALLIAAILFAAGFALYFAHQQLESKEQVGQILTPVTIMSASVLPVGISHDTVVPTRHI